MKYEAKVNFSGKISMCVGEVQDITDEVRAKDLVRAGYIVAVKPAAEVKAAKAKSTFNYVSITNISINNSTNELSTRESEIDLQEQNFIKQANT